MTLTAAVVGLGYFSQFHLAAWQALDGVDLAAVADRDPDLTDKTARRLGVPGHTSVEATLASDPDILDLVVPPVAHAALIRQCLKPGRTIICQKPFCTSLEEAEGVVAEAEAAGTTLVIHENFRFQPWHREVKRFLDAGRMGRVYGARFALRPGDGRGPRAYLDRQPTFQGMQQFLIRETGVHFIDLFRWFFGDIVSVYADLRRLNPAIAGEDAGALILTHAGGARAEFDGNRLADHVAANPRTTMGEMAIEGEAGVLTLDGYGKLWFREFGAAKAVAVPVTAPVAEDQFGGGCVAALTRHVVAALRGEGRLENTGRDYLAVIRACEAAYLSDRQGRRIDLISGSE